MMVSGSEGELFKNKTNPCGVCERRVMAWLIQCDAQNVETGLIPNAQKQRELPLGSQRILFA